MTIFLAACALVLTGLGLTTIFVVRKHHGENRFGRGLRILSGIILLVLAGFFLIITLWR